MIKVSRLLKRAAGVTPADFADAWQLHHGAALQGLASQRADVWRYSQSAAIGQDSPIANAPPSPFDGVDEVWCGSTDAAAAFFDAAAQGDHLRPFEDAFVDTADSAVLVGEVHTMWQRPARPEADAVKLMILPVRKAGLTVAEFLHHWIHVHSPLTLKGPTFRERVQRVEFCPRQDIAFAGLDVAGTDVADFDGSGSIWFDSARQMQAEFGSDYYRDVLQPDEPRFSDGSRSRGLMLRETRVWERDASRV